MKKYSYFLLLVLSTFFGSQAGEPGIQIKMKNVSNVSIEVVNGQKTSGIYSFLKSKYGNRRNKKNSNEQLLYKRC